MIKFQVDFDILNAAVLDYLQQHRHWPATFETLPQTNAYVIYRVVPGGDTAPGERLGYIKVRKGHGGATIDFEGAHTVGRRNIADWALLDRATNEAAARLQWEGYDEMDFDQVEKLSQMARADFAVRRVKLGLDAIINDDWLERYADYTERMEEAKVGLLAWLREQGIEEAGGGDENRPDDTLQVPTKYRLIVDLWNDGYTAKEIAERIEVSLSPGRIGNIITDQRNRLAGRVGKSKAAELIIYHRR